MPQPRVRWASADMGVTSLSKEPKQMLRAVICTLKSEEGKGEWLRQVGKVSSRIPPPPRLRRAK